MKRKLLAVAFAFVLCISARSQAAVQTRRVYEGVVNLKQETIGTIILINIDAKKRVTGWIRLEKFFPIESGTATADSVQFRAAGNSYRIDDKRNRVVYSGRDGSGDRLMERLKPVTGVFKELMEGEEFTGGASIATLDLNGRLERFNIGSPSLWKRHGHPFETFRRVDELLQRKVTFWVSTLAGSPTVEVVEEPKGMNIPLKAPKKSKHKRKK